MIKIDPERVRNLVANTGKSQSQYSEYCGYSEGYISKAIRSGKMSVEAVYNISKTLGVSPDCLTVKWDEEEESALQEWLRPKLTWHICHLPYQCKKRGANRCCVYCDLKAKCNEVCLNSPDKCKKYQFRGQPKIGGTRRP